MARSGRSSTTQSSFGRATDVRFPVSGSFRNIRQAADLELLPATADAGLIATDLISTKATATKTATTKNMRGVLSYRSGVNYPQLGLGCWQTQEAEGGAEVGVVILIRSTGHGGTAVARDPDAAVEVAAPAVVQVEGVQLGQQAHRRSTSRLLPTLERFRSAARQPRVSVNRGQRDIRSTCGMTPAGFCLTLLLHASFRVTRSIRRQRLQ
jgi:hypothetical protein